MNPHIVDVTDADGRVIAPGRLAAAESTHRELRPHLPSDYAATMQRIFAGGGRMSVAVVDDRVVGVAVHRIYENTFCGVHLYLDDLVTAAAVRSQGIGAMLLAHVRRVAVASGCRHVTLDSGTQRQQAHRFYFREGFVATAFHFYSMVGSQGDEHEG